MPIITVKDLARDMELRSTNKPVYTEMSLAEYVSTTANNSVMTSNTEVIGKAKFLASIGISGGTNYDTEPVRLALAKLMYGHLYNEIIGDLRVIVEMCEWGNRYEAEVRTKTLFKKLTRGM